MSLAAGTRLDSFEVVAPLGAGGMGEVYRARDTLLKRDVAIKVLPEYWSRDPERLHRFELEAQAAAALNHPNIVSIFHVGQYEGAPYIVTELLQGETLRDRLRRGPMRPGEVLDFGVELARGLGAAHDAGIVHRDLKPENIWVTKDGRIKILDFGLAKLDPVKSANADDPTITIPQQTSPGHVLGTVGYMSPEQVRGQVADARSDIFAVGVILYEMLTGKPAFRKATSAETMTAILNENPPAVSQIAPSVPPGLQRVVKCCLAKNQEQRFHHASDLAFALEALSDSSSAQIPTVKQVDASGKRWIWIATAGVVIVVGSVVASFVSLSDQNSYLSQTRLGMVARRAVLRRSTTPQPVVAERRLTANPEDVPVTSAVISPDGKYLAYTDKTGFYLKQVDNGETHPVPLPKGFEPLAESWFPDSIHMVVGWVENPTKPPSLWEISVLGGTPRKLANAGASPRVSPDGSMIASVAASSQNEIWLMQADGGRAHRIIGGSEAEARDYFSPVAWAPDGMRVAYVRTMIINNYNGRETKLEVADISTGKIDVVLSNPELGWAVGWADGNRLFYSVQEPAPNQNDFNLWRVQLDSHTAHPLGVAMRVTSGRGFAAGLSVTTDGKLLALRRQERRSGAYLADVEGSGKRLGNPKRLTLDEQEDYPTAWTPDSRAVLFFSDRDGPRRIFKQAIDQTQPELLVGGDEILATPRLNPDGNEVLYLEMPKPGHPSRSVRIMRVPLAGGPSQLVLEAPGILNQQCARLPSTLCIYSQHDPKHMRFITFDPVTGSGAEVVAAEIENSGGYNHWSLSPDGRYLASAKQGLNGVAEIRIFSIGDSSKRTLVVPHSAGVEGVDWAADGKSVWLSLDKSTAAGFGSYGGMAVFNVDLTGKITDNLENEVMWFSQAIPSPDGRRVAIQGETVNSNVWLLENF